MNLSDALCKAFLENNEDLFLVISDSALVLQLNHHIESICMIDRTKIVGSNFFDTCDAHAVQLSFNFDDIKKLAETAPSQDYFEASIKRNQIETIFKLKVIKAINENQNIYILIGKDITELLKYKKSSSITESYLQSIIENLPQYVYWKDTSFIYQGCNKFVSEYLHLKSPKDIVGKSDEDFGWSKDRVNFLRKVDESIVLKGETITTEDIIPLNNTSRIMMSTKAPLHNNFGKVIGIIGVSIDITEQKGLEKDLKKAKEAAEMALESLKQSQIEEQKQRKEAERLELANTKSIAELKIAQITVEKEQEMRKTVMMLVGDIVHDLRTPMATIDSATDILSSISPGLHDLIKEAHELKSKALESINGKKLDYVVNKMSITQKKAINFMGQFINTTLHELAVAQKHPEGNVAPEELSKCSIRRVLENTMEGYPRRKNLVINQCFSYDFIFMGNSILMLKMLFNLIKNADEQILANGKGEITITTKEVEDKNLLIIKDTAGGASPEIVENIFKEFFTTKKDGTGIGLAFCKKMMQSFGGDLTCHSVFGEYIEFTLSFPKTGETQPYNVKS